MSIALIVGQLRAHLVRYLATLLAVGVAVAFVVASGGLITTLYSSVLDVFSQSYKDSSVVVSFVGDRTSVTSAEDRADVAASEAQALAVIDAVPGVEAMTMDRELRARVIPRSGQAQHYTTITSLAVDERLRWQQLVDGRLPDGPGELLAPAGQDMSVGDTADLRIAGNADAQFATVVGTYRYIAQPDSTSDFPLFTTEAQVQQWEPDGAGGDIRILGDGTVSDAELSTAVARALLPVPGSDSFAVTTAAEKTQDNASLFLGSLRLLTGAISGFTVLAIAVSALVIATTFAVLMAGRIREMALLRTLGATRLQTRLMALTEATVVALLATGVGVLLGTWAVGAVSRNAGVLGVQFPLTAQPVPGRFYALGAFVGIVVTLGVALWPVLRATRHSPLAALRPVDVRAQSWWVRIVSVIAGLALAVVSWMALESFIANRNTVSAAVAGVGLFIGVLIGCSALIPMLLGLLGAAGSGLPGAMALLGTRNGARSPRRTSAIAAALLIAVTLMSALATGVAFLQPTVERKFVNRAPLDVAVSSPDGIIPDTLAPQLAAAPGVADEVVVTNYPLSVPDDSTSSGTRTVSARVADLKELQGLMTRTITLPAPGQIVVPASSPLYRYFFGGEGQAKEVRFFGDQTRQLTPIVSEDPWVIVNPADAPPWPEPQTPDGGPWPEGVEVPREFVPRHEVWLRLDDSLSEQQRDADLTAIRDIAAAARPDMTVAEAFGARDQLRDAVRTILTSTILLLGVSVLIALIGVVNTYTLAVSERRRELALLRGVGVTRAGVRIILMWEALLVAVAACGIGVVVGAFLGRSGAAALLGVDALQNASTPWTNVLMIGGAGVVVAVVAAGISSIRASFVRPAGMELR